MIPLLYLESTQFALTPPEASPGLCIYTVSFRTTVRHTIRLLQKQAQAEKGQKEGECSEVDNKRNVIYGSYFLGCSFVFLVCVGKEFSTHSGWISSIRSSLERSSFTLALALTLATRGCSDTLYQQVFFQTGLAKCRKNFIIVLAAHLVATRQTHHITPHHHQQCIGTKRSESIKVLPLRY